MDDIHNTLQFWAAPFKIAPFKIAPSHGGSEPPSNTYMVPWAHPSPQPKGHLDQFGPF